MAAAEYYNSAPQAVQSHSPFQYPSPAQGPTSHPSYGTPPSQHYLGQSHFQAGPPPYQAVNNESRPSVHFAPSPVPTPQQLHRPSISNSNSSPNPNYLAPPVQPYLAPQSLQVQHANSYHGTPANGSPSLYPQNPRPYMNGNQSMVSVGGYASDPEPNRRRRRSSDSKHRHDDSRNVSRDGGARKNRSRSTNADGFLGAAGGGLIGDLIFPGLGTVGGAVAGWIGGKDYGKHRKWKEGKRSQEQEAWERQWGRKEDRDGRRHDHHDHHHHHGGHHLQTHSRERRSWERHHSDY